MSLKFVQMPHDYVLQPVRKPVSFQIDYAAELNEQQYAAVTAPPGPSLVIAGAGSGKTRTLTYRVAYLLEQGIDPERILLLTFTNKAAKEMMRRVAELLGSELSGLWGGTFHSIGNRVLRRHAKLLGYQQDFSILDRNDAESLLKSCVADMKIDIAATRFPKPGMLADMLSLSANKSEPIKTILGAQFSEYLFLSPQIEELQTLYIARKLSTNGMDFDDLLILWLRLLKENPDVREEYQRRFAFVLVDEYQDTNRIQGELIDLLAARQKNLMVVGDDSQSIYAWRGAHFENIIRFPERYPEAKVYRIETNYRSTPEILEVANAAISPNVRQFRKALAPARNAGPKPVVVVCDTASQQGAFIAQRALELRNEGVELRNIAVLYRSHFHALELQMELTARNIPYSITSGIRFYEQAHIKDVVAWLKLVTNPADELAFKRIVGLLKGVGERSAEKLWKTYCVARAETLSATSPLATLLQKCSRAIPKKSEVSWAQFLATVAQLEDSSARTDPSKMIQTVTEAVYEDYLKANFANYQARRDDLNQLAEFAHTMSSLDEFLTQIALQTSVEAQSEVSGSEGNEKIRLSTIHQAKGLEFDIVFVITLCEGLFPSARSAKTQDGLEEERRLFYVAITRARNQLYLSYPARRWMADTQAEVNLKRSEFLDDIPPFLLDAWNLRSPGY